MPVHMSIFHTFQAQNDRLLNVYKQVNCKCCRGFSARTFSTSKFFKSENGHTTYSERSNESIDNDCMKI